MGLDSQALRHGLDAIAAREPRIAHAIEVAGYPEPRIRSAGYATLLRTIVGQQVSVAAAASVWNRLETLLGEDLPAPAVREGLPADGAAIRLAPVRYGLFPA